MNKRLSKAFGILFLILELIIVPKAMELMLNQPLSSLSPIEIIVISMTFGSIALCIIMSFAAMSENENYPAHTFLFELMIFLCSLAPMTDLLTMYFDSINNRGLNMLVNTLFYFLGISISFTIMLYEFLLIDADKKPKLKKVKRFATILVILDYLTTILNIKFGFFFTITENGLYQSAPTYLLAYIAPIIIIAITSITAFKEMKKGKQQRAFIFFWVFAIISSLIQVCTDSLSIHYTGYTLSLIVIYINIQCDLDTYYTSLNDKEES